MGLWRPSLALVLLAVAPSALSGTTLCTKGERTHFSCTVTKNKLLSVCGSNRLTAKSGYIQYRFGTPSSVELIYPPAKAHPNDHFYFHEAAYSGGYMAHLSFRVGAYRYVVYDHYSSAKSPRETNTKDAGVLVIEKSKTERYLKCRSPHDARFDDANLLAVILKHDDFFPYR